MMAVEKCADGIRWIRGREEEMTFYLSLIVQILE